MLMIQKINASENSKRRDSMDLKLPCRYHVGFTDILAVSFIGVDEVGPCNALTSVFLHFEGEWGKMPEKERSQEVKREVDVKSFSPPPDPVCGQYP